MKNNFVHLTGGNDRTQIMKAIAAYHKYTCIRFQPRQSEANSIIFVDGGGCSSFVGMKGGQQEVTLGRGCRVVRHAAFTRSLFPCRNRIFLRPCKRASRFPRRPFTRRALLVEKLACQLFDEDLRTRKIRQFLVIYTTSFSRRGKSDRVNAYIILGKQSGIVAKKTMSVAYTFLHDGRM